VRCHVLIDYDNVRGQRERSRLDASMNLEDLIENLIVALRRVVPDVKELHIRLYGGWVDERGQFSHVANWITAALEDQRGIRGGRGVAFRGPDSIALLSGYGERRPTGDTYGPQAGTTGASWMC
jgi:hypothetical protein